VSSATFASFAFLAAPLAAALFRGATPERCEQRAEELLPLLLLSTLVLLRPLLDPMDLRVRERDGSHPRRHLFVWAPLGLRLR
jgi:hypothetical protein